MSKIVQAVNVMITFRNNIRNVVKSSDEIYFLYKEKYKWSMASREDGYHLWFYPGKESLEDVITFTNQMDYEYISMVHYLDKEIGTKEASASFADLYTILSEKIYGIDEVLDDIISDEMPF